LIAGEFHIRFISCFMAKVAGGKWLVASGELANIYFTEICCIIFAMSRKFVSFL